MVAMVMSSIAHKQIMLRSRHEINYWNEAAFHFHSIPYSLGCRAIGFLIAALKQPDHFTLSALIGCSVLAVLLVHLASNYESCWCCTGWCNNHAHLTADVLRDQKREDSGCLGSCKEE